MGDEKVVEDPLGVLSKFSGVDRGTVDKIWEAVKANHKILAECERPHDFEPIGTGPLRKERCKKCGGIVDAVNATYYKQGLKDGSRKAPRKARKRDADGRFKKVGSRTKRVRTGD
mgnify:CR=1 FL=1